MNAHSQRKADERKAEILRLLEENNRERARILDEQRRSNRYWEEQARIALQIGADEAYRHIRRSNEEANERFAEIYVSLDEQFDELSREFEDP